MKSFIRYLAEATTPISHKKAQSDFEKVLLPLVGKEVTPAQIAKATERLSKKYFFSTTVRTHAQLDKSQISIVGFYDIEGDQEWQEDKSADYPIEIFLLFSPKDKKLSFVKDDVARLSYGLADTIVHERLHMDQAKARNYKQVPHKKKYVHKVENIQIGSYLARDDEIEAYALNIALALKDHFHTQKERFDFLKRPKQGVIQDPHFDQYLDVFGFGHPVVKRLFKKIVGYLNNAKL